MKSARECAGQRDADHAFLSEKQRKLDGFRRAENAFFEFLEIQMVSDGSEGILLGDNLRRNYDSEKFLRNGLARLSL